MTQHGTSRVVKVQAALAGSHDSTGRGLVYAEGRRHAIEQPLPAAVYDYVAARPNRKAYFEAVWIGDGWEIGSLTADQPW